MIALRLVHLIESHSEQLAESLVHKLEHSSRAADLRKVPEQEIRERAREVYRHLSDWILTKTDDDIERFYTPLGRRRAAQGVSLSALCWALMTTEENLWDFLELEGMREKPLEILGGFELLRLLDRFFDQVIYFAALGYESYWKDELAEAVHPSRGHAAEASLGGPEAGGIPLEIFLTRADEKESARSDAGNAYLRRARFARSPSAWKVISVALLPVCRFQLKKRSA